jgi:uncharacterized SAM-binding protein YcdF (DUF218 family)
MPAEQDCVMVGADGWATLVLSCVVLFGSFGLTALASLFVVLRGGWRTPIAVPGCGRIIVLGHRLESGDRPSAHYSERLRRALALLEASPGASVYLLGGRSPRCTLSEAEVGANYLVTCGICSSRIRREDRSRHTLENLQRYRYAVGATEAESTALVTSRFHLARAGMVARGLDVPHCLCAAESRPRICWPMLQEAFLIHWYVTGRTFARWTGNTRMLARIS